MDTLFQCSDPLDQFNVRTRTHHRNRFANILYSDGHSESRANDDERYSVDVRDDGQLHESFSKSSPPSKLRTRHGKAAAPASVSPRSGEEKPMRKHPQTSQANGSGKRGARMTKQGENPDKSGKFRQIGCGFEFADPIAPDSFFIRRRPHTAEATYSACPCPRSSLLKTSA